LLTADKSRLLGYLIYFVEGQAAVCADLLVLDGAEGLGSLLSCWAALAWRDGLASLSLSCSDGALPANLLHHGFTRRSAAPTTKPGQTRRHELCKTLFTHELHPAMEPAVPDRWYYTEGDSPY
jgi:hypothetical protein